MKRWKWLAAAVVVVTACAILERLEPIELCCIPLPAAPKVGSEKELEALQRSLIASGEREHWLPSLSTLRLLSAGRKFGPQIYGKDGRTDLAGDAKQKVDPAVLANMNATALIVDRYFLKPGTTKEWKLESDTLLSHGVCNCEPFSDQQCALKGNPCTAFLIDEQHVATAKHCIDPEKLIRRLFVFRFHQREDLTTQPEFDGIDVVEPHSVIFESEPCGGHDPDLVIVRLKEKVKIPPIRRSTSPLREKDEVYLLGYPLGLGAKYAPDAFVRPIDLSVPYFVTNIDGYDGNSGSPVFNKAHEVVGVHVRGVIALARPCGCKTSTWCPDTGCRGEEVTRIAFLPESSSYYEADGTLKKERPAFDPCSAKQVESGTFVQGRDSSRTSAAKEEAGVADAALAPANAELN